MRINNNEQIQQSGNSNSTDYQLFFLFAFFMTHQNSYSIIFRQHSDNLHDLDLDQQIKLILAIQQNMSISTTRHKKYFSLIDKSLFPSLMNKNQEKDSTKATISLLKKNKFIYLDMNATNGFKAMEMNPEPESDQEDEVYGPYVVCEGVKTSREKVKLKEFMTINHKIRQKHNLMRSRVKQQLDKSRDKFATLNNSPHNSRPLLKLHRGLDIQKYNQIKNSLQTEEINAEILKKESKMMQKLGIVADFQSVREKNTPSYVQKSKKTESYFLPRILKSHS